MKGVLDCWRGDLPHFDRIIALRRSTISNRNKEWRLSLSKFITLSDLHPPRMAILESIGLMFLGAVIKSVVDWVTVRVHAAESVSAKVAAANEALPVGADTTVDHIHFRRYLFHNLADRRYGMFVLGAPTGSGKSTMIGVVLEQFRRKQSNRHALYFKRGESILKRQSLNLLLGFPEDDALSDNLPAGSILVIDQVDFPLCDLTADMKSYLRQIATDSYNSKRYHVVVVVSNPQVMRAILRLNNSEKIQALCPPGVLQWDQQLLRQLIEERFGSWTVADKEMLLHASTNAQAPGVVSHVQNAVPTASDSSPVPRTTFVNMAENYSTAKQQMWEEFDQALYDILFGNYTLP